MDATRKVLAFSAAVEGATGLALVVVPAVVSRLLLGDDLPALGSIVARCFGIALVALSLAVWPGVVQVAQAARAMLLYNTGLAIYLAWLGTAGQAGGPALWPAAVIHALIAILLARPATA